MVINTYDLILRQLLYMFLVVLQVLTEVFGYPKLHGNCVLNFEPFMK